MRGYGSKCKSLPETSGLQNDSFGYSLTAKGKSALAEWGAAAERHALRRALVDSSKAQGKRSGTVCGRWRDNKQVPEVRLSGNWLQAAGFDLGQIFEVAVEKGVLLIRTA